MTYTANCHYCGKTNEESELRPYGPGGSWVCFPCATESPEREEVTQASFGALLGAAEAMGPVIVLGQDGGPVGVSAEEAEKLLGL